MVAGLGAALAGALALGARVRAQQIVDLDVPFVRTPDSVVLSMLELGGCGPDDELLDLGSGDGRIPITAALKYGTRGVGVEIDPHLIGVSRDNARRAGVADKVEFVQRDLFVTDLSRATLITMYLLPDVNVRLRPKLLELAPGTRVVSHDWDMGDWAADKGLVVPAPNKPVGLIKQSKLWLWIVPAHLQGRHVGRWDDGAPLELTIEQRYQMTTGGRVVSRGVAYAIASGRVRGRSVDLEAWTPDGRRLRLAGETRDGTTQWEAVGAAGARATTRAG